MNNNVHSDVYLMYYPLDEQQIHDIITTELLSDADPRCFLIKWYFSNN